MSDVFFDKEEKTNTQTFNKLTINLINDNCLQVDAEIYAEDTTNYIKQYNVNYQIEINYCPICGRNIKEDT